MRRKPTSELLDTDSGTPEEIAASLLDLRGINRSFGGVATTQSMIEIAAKQTNSNAMSLLEVASGNGYVPLQVRNRLLGNGLDLDITLLDRAASHIPNHGTRAVVGDAVSLPFSDGSFDLVHCSLFVHHLSPAEVVTFAKEALRVARTALLINDIVRSAIHLALVYASVPLYHSRLTRHDAPASVWQAYTAKEMTEMLKKAGAKEVEIQRHYLYRMGVIAWKP